MKQTDIINILKSIKPDIKITQPWLSRVLSGKEKIPFDMAYCLEKLFPEGKDILQWREQATPEELKQAFKNLESKQKEQVA